jgi:2-methylcitrate dehydratase PrpD
VLQAALINGATSHALDFDDAHTGMSGHPTVPVLPAALALAERDDRSGADLLASFIAGVELECRLGALLNPEHYEAGFHATSTLGIFGAAAAAAWLLDLDEEGWRRALGLAATQAAGLKASFGTMAKPLHAGKAASDGLFSALLARGGYTAHQEVLEAPQGFARTHGLKSIAPSRLAHPEDRYAVRDTLFKYHAACYFTHSAIEGALALRGRMGEPRDVRRVTLEVAEATGPVCNIERPVTGLEGKFSYRAVVAMALLGDDTGDPAAYSDARMVDPELVALRDRIDVKLAGGTPGTRSRITIDAGEASAKLEASFDVGRPAEDLDCQWERLSAKYFALATPVLGAERARALHAAAAAVEDLRSIRELLALAVPAQTGASRRQRTA